jgi:hypothetical protein
MYDLQEIYSETKMLRNMVFFTISMASIYTQNFRQDNLSNQDPDQGPHCTDPYPTKKVQIPTVF